MSDNIYTPEQAKLKLIAGITKTCEVIKPTYGSAGSNVILEHNLYPYHDVTNDGKKITDAIKLEDRVENMGTNILREVADKAEKDSGDGRKTTCLLTQAILTEGLKTDAQPLDIKRSLDECLPVVLESIDAQTKLITVDEVGAVAAISSENEKIGSIIQEIYQKVGAEGIIELENSNTFETSYDLREGVKLRGAGFMAPYMATEGSKALYENPYILITKQKINSINDIDPIIKQLVSKGINDLVIFCDDIDPTVLGALAQTHILSIFKTLIIRCPNLWKDWLFEDFALITGATIVSPETAVSLGIVGINHLGTCDKIVTTREETTVLGIKDVSEHVKKIEAQAKNDPQLRLRLAWLNTKAAVLKIGANSESELSYISKKTKDAVSASYWALQGGVVPGGGVTLYKAGENLPDTIGGTILREALKAPHNQILENLNISRENTASFGENVIDPAIVVKNAVTNAISVASTILTAKSVLVLNHPDHENS